MVTPDFAKDRHVLVVVAEGLLRGAEGCRVRGPGCLVRNSYFGLNFFGDLARLEKLMLPICRTDDGFAIMLHSII